MSAPISTSPIVEASKVAVSFLSNIGNSIPVIFGCMAVSVFLALTFPDGRIRYYSFASAVFFAAYFVGLWRVHTIHMSHQKWAIKHTLTKDERLILQRYLKEDRAVCYFPLFHGASASLLAAPSAKNSPRA
jgi:hypothetical protein